MKNKLKAVRPARPRISQFKKHPFVIPVVTFLVLFVASLVGFIGFNSRIDSPSGSHIIEFSVEGERRSIPTRAKTVSEFLERSGTEIGEFDIVEPGLDEEIYGDKFHINVYKARPITIIDDKNGNRKFAYSAATTPRSVVKQAGVEIFPEDRIESTVPDSFLKEGVLGERVVIERSTPADINLYGQHVPVRTHATTVEELLAEKNVQLGDDDSVKPSLDSPVKPNMQIFVIRSGTKLVTEDVEIPMPEEIVEDARLSFGTQAVRQQGSPGKKVITYQIILRNGKEVGRKKIQEVISKEPVKQIVARGKAIYIPSDKRQIMAQAGVSESDYAYVDYIISRESGWCPTKVQGNYGSCPAYVPSIPSYGGYGLCQSTPPQKMATVGADWQSSAVTQLRWCSGYAHSRHGGWQGAYNFWVNNHWW